MPKALFSSMVAAAIGCGFGLGAGASAGAVTFATNAFADAFVTPGINGNLANNNYGGAGALAVAASGLPQGAFQSVVQFNLGGARSAFDTQFGAGHWSFQSVTLQLSAQPANNALFNAPSAGQFGVSWMQNDSWQEGAGAPGAPASSGLTFASLQASVIQPGDENLGTFGYNGAANGTVSFSLGLTPGFTADLVAGDNVSLRLFAADGSVSGIFSSRNFGTASGRPLLSVVAVPEPGVRALIGSGLLLLFLSMLGHRSSRPALPISQDLGSTRALACSRRRLADGRSVRTHSRLGAGGAPWRRGAASSTRGACAPQTGVRRIRAGDATKNRQ